jgi:hypothetical protein
MRTLFYPTAMAYVSPGLVLVRVRVEARVPCGPHKRQALAKLARPTPLRPGLLCITRAYNMHPLLTAAMAVYGFYQAKARTPNNRVPARVMEIISTGVPIMSPSRCQKTWQKQTG